MDEVDAKGRHVCSSVTKKVTENQLPKVKYVLDSEKAITYEAVRSKGGHGLTEWRSNRAESSLEKFHERLAHFANIGCGTELAEALNMRGVAEYNTACRWRYGCNEKRKNGVDLDHPKYLDSTPIFMDHSALHHLNEQCRNRQFPVLFPDCRVPKKNNGETFGTEYLEEELARKQDGVVPGDNKRCTCTDCISAGHSVQNATSDRQSAGRNVSNRTPPTRIEAFIPIPPPVQGEVVTQVTNLAMPSTNGMVPQLETIRPDEFSFEAVKQAPILPVPLCFTTDNNPWKLGNRCYPYFPYHCRNYGDYLARNTKGRPPHDPHCPIRVGYKYLFDPAYYHYYNSNR